MGCFSAKLELPEYFPKEEILNKKVFDAEIKFIGPVIDWTYSSDGTIKMIVKNEDDPTKVPVLIPFFQIHTVGEHIILKVKKGELKTEFGVTLSKVPLKSESYSSTFSSSRKGRPPPLFQ